MKKFFIFILNLWLFYACTSPVSPPGPNVINPDKMTNILIDIHVAESRIEHMGLLPDTSNVYFKKLQQDIFKAYKITKKDFYTSYDYYTDNVSELDKIYERVIDSLSVREVQATKTEQKLIKVK